MAPLLIAAIGLAAPFASAQTSGAASLGLAGKEFGNGKSISVESTGAISPWQGYNYKVEGVCKGTGALATLIPSGTNLNNLLNSLKPGSSKILSGYLENPTGELPVESLLNRTINATREIPGLGTVNFVFNMKGAILASGKITFDISKVSIKTATGAKVDGTILMQQGSKVSVTAAPQHRFFNKGQNVKENTEQGTVTVKIQRFGNTDIGSSVLYTVTDGSAVAGRDYSFTFPKSAKLTFKPGEKEKNLTFTVINNTAKDATRKFQVVLTTPSKGSLVGSPSVHTVGIVSED